MSDNKICQNYYFINCRLIGSVNKKRSFIIDVRHSNDNWNVATSRWSRFDGAWNLDGEWGNRKILLAFMANSCCEHVRTENCMWLKFSLSRSSGWTSCKFLPFSLNKLLCSSGRFKLSVISSSTSPCMGRTGEFSCVTTNDDLWRRKN
jgi:hypothetical protein